MIDEFVVFFHLEYIVYYIGLDSLIDFTIREAIFMFLTKPSHL
jgi:hypothetical protein